MASVILPASGTNIKKLLGDSTEWDMCYDLFGGGKASGNDGHLSRSTSSSLSTDNFTYTNEKLVCQKAGTFLCVASAQITKYGNYSSSFAAVSVTINGTDETIIKVSNGSSFYIDTIKLNVGDSIKSFISVAWFGSDGAFGCGSSVLLHRIY